MGWIVHNLRKDSKNLTEARILRERLDRVARLSDVGDIMAVLGIITQYFMAKLKTRNIGGLESY